MPFILRDNSGKICRAGTREIPGAEVVPYDHPELVEFVRNNGQDPEKIMAALTELRKTDVEMTRAVEDVIMALLKKNLLKMGDLPKAVQDRMSLRVRLRVSISEIYDQASGIHNVHGHALNPLNVPPATEILH